MRTPWKKQPTTIGQQTFTSKTVAIHTLLKKMEQEKHGWTFKDLSDMVGCSEAMISITYWKMVEQGKIQAFYQHTKSKKHQ